MSITTQQLVEWEVSIQLTEFVAQKRGANQNITENYAARSVKTRWEDGQAWVEIVIDFGATILYPLTYVERLTIQRHHHA